VIERLTAMARQIWVQERATFGMVAPDAAKGKGVLEQMFAPLTSAPNLVLQPCKLPLTASQKEFITTNTEVNFVGMALKAHAFHEVPRAAEVLLGQYLTVGQLWHAIRMQGGAYGVSASATGTASGMFTMTSYRDPQMSRTLEVFRSALSDFKGISQEELEDTLIARVGKESRPTGPAESLSLAMKRSLYNISTATRQRVRNHLLEVSPAQMQESASYLASQLSEAKMVVITNAAQAEKEASALGISTVTKLAK
jgi:presequence protease